MQSLLESFLYVLSQTLPVGLIIGLLFFAVGYLLTNPRLRRTRQQSQHYKDECARMSRNLAKISNQHQEVLESIQLKEEENLKLQTTLETKDEELIALLDRLNTAAAESESAVEDARGSRQEDLQRLQRKVAELTSRVETAEATATKRKEEVEHLTQRLLEAVAPRQPDSAGRTAASSSTKPEATEPVESESQPEIPLLFPEAHSPLTGPLFSPSLDTDESHGPLSASADSEEPSLENAETRPLEEPIEERVPDTPVEQPAAVETSQPLPEPEPLANLFDDDASELAEQLSEFEERLRRKEAEFFSMTESLVLGKSTGTGESSTPSSSAGVSTAEAPPSDFAGASSSFPPITSTNVTPLHPSSQPASQPAFPSGEAIAKNPKSAAREQVIFRGSDPSLWGQSTGSDVGIPSDVSEGMHFLRLRRLDTGQSIIIPAERADLMVEGSAKAVLGWNGSATTFDGGRHLGIFDQSLPQEVETRFGAGGWGFGHRYGRSGEGQAYAWAGIAIERTEFEISVLYDLPDVDALASDHTTLLDSQSVPSSEGRELVFFHSSTPSIWNKNVVDGRGGFALNICRAPVGTRYLRLRRVDNGSAVYLAISRDDLLLEKANASGGPAWKGGAHERNGARTLGLEGYGFAPASDGGQGYFWDGVSVPRTAFEFSALARDLDADEQKSLLNG